MANIEHVLGAASTAVTLTIPARAGSYTAIHAIRLGRTATAALAGSAVVNVTSTNISDGAGNTVTWRVGNLMVAGGTTTDVNMTFPEPLYGDAPGVAITIIMADPGDAVLWDAEVAYSYIQTFNLK